LMKSGNRSSEKDANSTDNVAERVTMCRPDAIEHIASLFCEQTQIEVGTLKLEVIGMLRRSRYASYSLSFVAKHLSFSGPFKL